MKTFLHYTKERELDESITGSLGTLTRVISNVGQGANTFKKNISPSFNKGGNFFDAVSNVASMVTNRAEKNRQGEFQMDSKIDDIGQRIDRIDIEIIRKQKELAAVAAGSRASIQISNAIDDLQNEKLELVKKIKSIKDIKKPEELEKIQRTQIGTSAAGYRAKY